MLPTISVQTHGNPQFTWVWPKETALPLWRFGASRFRAKKNIFDTERRLRWCSFSAKRGISFSLIFFCRNGHEKRKIVVTLLLKRRKNLFLVQISRWPKEQIFTFNQTSKAWIKFLNKFVSCSELKELSGHFYYFLSVVGQTLGYQDLEGKKPTLTFWRKPRNFEIQLAMMARRMRENDTRSEGLEVAA